MIKLRHKQLSLWAGILKEEIEDLWEPWMREVDQLSQDEALVERVYEAQGERHPHSRTRGRTQTPAEVVLRLLILKHVRNWSYETLEREVRANLVYRSFARMGVEKVPDAKTLGRLGQAIGPEAIRDLHERLVKLAQENQVVRAASCAWTPRWWRRIFMLHTTQTAESAPLAAWSLTLNLPLRLTRAGAGPREAQAPLPYFLVAARRAHTARVRVVHQQTRPIDFIDGFVG